MSKLLLFAAPSGAGKTTIVKHLLQEYEELAFSISATTRPRRPHEVDGQDYYFISGAQFQEFISQDAFLEWEEVYPGSCYGTLRREVERLWALGKHIVFDIDVLGALNIKKQYPEASLAVFIQPPSLEALHTRLRARNTESEESLQKRLDKAAEEMAFENQFDLAIVNDELESALAQAERIVEQFIYQS